MHTRAPRHLPHSIGRCRRGHRNEPSALQWAGYLARGLKPAGHSALPYCGADPAGLRGYLKRAPQHAVGKERSAGEPEPCLTLRRARSKKNGGGTCSAQRSTAEPSALGRVRDKQSGLPVCPIRLTTSDWRRPTHPERRVARAALQAGANVRSKAPTAILPQNLLCHGSTPLHTDWVNLQTWSLP